MDNNELFDDPDELVSLIDEEDVRWGMAIPQQWVHRDTYRMTSQQEEIYARLCERRSKQDEAE